MRLPKRLRPGDTVGIFSPSAPISAEAVELMKEYFERLGYRVKIAPNTLAVNGFTAGTPQQRADDLNNLLHDPSVRMVMTSMGGAGAIHLLPLVHYAALQADPKIVVGLSDPSILLSAITAATGVPTFHGPNGVEFGGLCPLTLYCEQNFWPLISEDLDLPYTFPLQGQFRVLRSGSPVEGTLLGGNLERTRLLLATPWEPDWNGAILFIEEYQAKLIETDAMLAHLRLAGVLDRIGALLVGQPVGIEPAGGWNLEDIILQNCANGNFPIITGLLIGHTDDKLTLPVGCRVRVQTDPVSLQLLEPVTAASG